MAARIAQPLIEHREAIAKLCREHGVERLEVFGSGADGRFDPQRSDFDFIARFAPEALDTVAQHYVAFNEALERLLGRHVDLMTDHAIENPYFRRAVDATRHEIYVRAPAQASA
ncbi:MAG: nucleotidyltransferase domain-containing protein [Burkholderiaceae bacterium]|nr:nucleotidyltransferase domain-containing protein [Burkholderiaceae bacterium]